MATYRSFPIINTIIADIVAAKTEQHDYIDDLLNILNGVTTDYVMYDVFGNYAPILPDSLDNKLVFAMINFNESNPRQGFLFYRGNKKYWFVSLDYCGGKCFPYELEPGKVKGYDNQCLTILEIREAIKTGGASGDLNPHALADIMEGGIGLSVDLNEAQTKVVAGLDLTGGVAGNVLKINSSADGVEWGRELPDASGHLGEVLTHITTGNVWQPIPTPEKIKATNVPVSNISYNIDQGNTVITVTGQTEANKHYMVMWEVEDSNIHYGGNAILHPYDNTAVCYSAIRTVYNGSIKDVTMAIDTDGDIIINLIDIVITGSNAVTVHLFEVE